MKGAEMSDSPHSKRYEDIDVLRGVAAVSVLLYHAVALGNMGDLKFGTLEIFIRNGWMGVDLFFVISGFVITLALAKDMNIPGKRFYSRFFVRRFYRIAPLYYLTILVFILMLQPHLFFLSWESQVAHFGSHLLFLHNLHPSTHGSIVGPNWTVALEVQFYIFICLMIKKLIKMNPLVVYFLFVSTAWLWKFVITLILEPGASNANTQSIFSQMLPGTLDEFGVGVFLALLVFRRKNEGRIEKAFSLIEKNSYYQIGILSLFAGSFYFHLRFLNSLNYWGNPFAIVFFRTTLAISFGLLLVFVISKSSKSDYLGSALRFLGKISYGIYLWHILIIIVVNERLPWLQGYKVLVLVTVLTLILAAYTYFIIEKPMIKKGAQVSNRI
jgi:peptidoglycan/LPS O-acetylase OafA/YrhL